MQSLVLDTSVTGKWYLQDESQIDKATSLLQKIKNKEIEPVLPSLWIYEMANIFYAAVLAKRITKRRAENFINQTQELNFKLTEISSIIKDILQNALKYKVSVYDASYLTLAELKKCDFVTSDKKLFNKLKDKISFVKWLGEY